jgi:PAS domain S-box-containing protein
MEALVESSDDAIISQTLTGIITSWNPAAERMYGYASEEIIGKSISVLIPKDRSNEMEDNLANISAGGPVHRDTQRVRRDGSVFRVSLTVSPIHDSDGALAGTSVIYRALPQA